MHNYYCSHKAVSYSCACCTWVVTEFSAVVWRAELLQLWSGRVEDPWTVSSASVRGKVLHSKITNVRYQLSQFLKIQSNKFKININCCLNDIVQGRTFHLKINIKWLPPNIFESVSHYTLPPRWYYNASELVGMAEKSISLFQHDICYLYVARLNSLAGTGLVVNTSFPSSPTILTCPGDQLWQSSAL